MAKAKYYKLGKTAASFYDPIVKLKIAGDGMGKLNIQETRRIRNAVQHGHLKEVTQKEYEEWVAGEQNSEAVKSQEEHKLDLSTLTSSKLTKYYKDNYDVTADDVKKFDKMDKNDKVAFLQADEEDDEE